MMMIAGQKGLALLSSKCNELGFLEGPETAKRRSMVASLDVTDLLASCSFSYQN